MLLQNSGIFFYFGKVSIDLNQILDILLEVRHYNFSFVKTFCLRNSSSITYCKGIIFVLDKWSEETLLVTNINTSHDMIKPTK